MAKRNYGRMTADGGLSLFRPMQLNLTMPASALRAFLQTPHPKMPNLILTPDQSADVIAFLLSLRDRRRPETNP